MIPKDPDTVYVTLGRKCGKTMVMARQLEEIYKSGKKVVIVEPKCTPKQTKHIPYSSGLIDMDILTPEKMKRAEEMLSMILKPGSDS